MTGRGTLADGSMAPPAAKKTNPPVTVGWREWVGFPELWDGAIKAKIDTGARTSAIHAFNIRIVRRGGTRYARFEIHPVQHRKMPAISCVAAVHDRRYVTSSNGIREKRYIIVTKLRIGARLWPIELALTNRDEMGFRVLIGRQALRGHALVNPGRSYLAPRWNSGGPVENCSDVPETGALFPPTPDRGSGKARP